MDKQSAAGLLNQTFNSEFNERLFAKFATELFNKFDITKKTWTVWKEYQNYINSYYQLGSYQHNKKTIDVLVVNLKKTSSRDRARTMQRNFIAKYLSNADKDAALVAFYGEDPQDWRFSFVKMEYQLQQVEPGKVKPIKELTPAKRYSFLVGVNEPNYTCRKQFLKMVMEEETGPSIEEIEQAFGIENVTKEFFLEYKELYLMVKESLEKTIKNNDYVKKEFEEKNISTVDFAKKLLGQIVFIYFLQKKGWLGVSKDEKGRFKEWGTGPKNFLRKLYDKQIVDYKNFFNDVLEPLFYEALATERDDDYYSRFNCKIPFLNGGLFEPINDYNWAGTEIFLDNSIFDKILSTFDRFNFTVKEDEPLEKEVAIDPEMLGKVFENLLEVKDRKSKGSYYTPREIVHYMCQQSLINYLETNTGLPRKDIERFVQLGDFALDMIIKEQEQLKKYGKTYDINEKYALPKTIKENHEKINQLLKDIKIVDPAVGSGAFPVGMMNEIVKARSILSLVSGEEKSVYDLKRETIENCLYGVDIDSSAIDIAKLRFWLSLIVDELDMKNIKPLPNLDHKIMCGNSLLEEFEGIKLFDEWLLGETKKDNKAEEQQIKAKKNSLYQELGQINLGKKKDEGRSKEIKKEINALEKRLKKLKEAPEDEPQQQTLNDVLNKRIKESQKKLSELRKLQKEFFSEQNRKRKKEQAEQINRLEWELIEETLKEQGNEESIKKLEQYNKNKSKPFFLWKLYFSEIFQRENPGFDVVIANPPYVSAWSMKNEDEEMRSKIKKSLSDYNILSGHWDLYISFVAKGHQILRKRACLSYIVPNPILREKYASETRKFLLKDMRLQSVLEFSDINVFENVSRRTTVLVALKEHNPEYSIGIYGNLYENQLIKQINSVKNTEWLANPNYLFVIKSTPANQQLLSKIENSSDKIGNFFYVNYGAQLTSKKKGEFRKKDIVGMDAKGNAKKFFEGKDLHRYRVDWRGLWLDYKQNKLYGSRCPDLFETDKIVIRHISDKKHRLAAAIDFGKKYCDHGLIIVVPYSKIEKTPLLGEFKGYKKATSVPNIKYTLGIILSNLTGFYFRNRFATESLQGSTSHTYPASVRGLPIKNISKKEQNTFIVLVDKILSITKSSDYLDDPKKQAEVKKLEAEINKLVYNLYDLTPEEIKIVEEVSQK